MLSLTRKTPDPAKALTPAQVERAAAAELIRLEAEIKRRELESAAAFAAEIAEHERSKARANLDQQTKAARSTAWAGVVQGWTARFVPFAPLVLVNTMAVFGQLGWGRTHLTQVGANEHDLSRWVIAILFAATLESIALFLAYYANRALNRGDSATALYLGAFGVAAVVAAVNYSHYAAPETLGVKVEKVLGLIPPPTAMGVVFALCSVASPWLWRIKHRDANRDRLHELGVIDAKAVKLSMSSKIWHPYRSFMVMWYATWARETNPAAAVAQYEAIVAAAKARKAEAKSQRVTAKDKAPTATEPPADDPQAPEDPPAVQDAQEDAQVVQPLVLAPLPAEATIHPHLWEIVRDTDEAGNRISGRELARKYAENNRHHARAVITAYLAWKGMTQHVNGSRTAAA
jgi:hypothetical protein